MVGLAFWVCFFLIAYVYAVYPVLLALAACTLGRLRKQVKAPVAELPSVTVLIAAYNEEATIANKLENTLALDYPCDKLQIIVAADGSTDRTIEVVRRYAARGIELSFSPARQGKMAAINHAMASARGDVVILSDANNTFGRGVAREMVALFADASVGAVSGAKVILAGDGVLGDSEGLYWRYESRIKIWETKIGSCAGVSAEIFALRRRLFEPPPENIINDDYYIAADLIRRGHRVVYAPEARSFERISASPKDEITRRARIFAGRYQALMLAGRLLPLNRPLVAWELISHQYMRTLLPMAMLGAVLANLIAVIHPAASGGLLAMAPPLSWTALWLQLGFYGMALAGARLEGKASRLKLLYIPTFLVNSNWAGLIGLVGFLSGRQTTLWARAQRRGEPGLDPADAADQHISRAA